MTVEPFRRPDGGAVISYIDITRRRQAEDESRRQRAELAHAQRVTTLGELGASLAHEINQPLAAIVTNAQAAIRLLGRDGIVHADVSEALTDMAADAQRASAIIRRLRALSRKEHASQRGLDLNELVDDVVIFLRYDLARKNITVLRTADPVVPLVSGGPIQLQQVILNLLVNASEAIGNAPDGPREIAITTALRGPGLVEVRVRDYRRRREQGRARAHVRAVRQHQARRPRHGPGDQPIDRGGARWAYRGGGQPRSRPHAPRRAARATARFRAPTPAPARADQPARMGPTTHSGGRNRL